MSAHTGSDRRPVERSLRTMKNELGVEATHANQSPETNPTKRRTGTSSASVGRLLTTRTDLRHELMRVY